MHVSSAVKSARRGMWAVCLGLLAVGLSGCSGCGFDPVGCSTDSDCRTGRVCADSVCVDPGLVNNVTNNVNNNLTPDMLVSQDLGSLTDMASSDAGRDMPGAIDLGLDQGNPPEDMAVADMQNPPDMQTPVDMATPDMAIPDMNMPPDMNVPDMAVADMNMPPDMATPDMGIPDMGTPVIGPQISVSPAQTINFGNNPIGATVNVTLNVSNVGDAPLSLTSLDLRARPSQGFDVQPVVAMPVVIAPGQRRAFVASFSPQAAAGYRNFVDIASDDADDPTVSVELTGRGFATMTRACLYSSPDTVDFGVVTPGSSATQEITVGNCSSTEVVTVTQLRLASMNPNAPFTFVPSKTVPFAIPVGGSEKITVKYSPTTNVDTQDDLQIRSDSQLSPISTVQLVGSGGGCPDVVARGESVQDLLGADELRQGTVVIKLGDSVALSADQSSAPSGQLATTWRTLSRPAGSVADVQAPGAIDTTLTPDKAGVYVLELDGRDLVTNTSACSTSTLEVVVLGAEPRLQAQITWNADHDVDLHIQRSVGQGWPMLGDMTNDLFYDHANADWGMLNNPLDNGFHLGDDADGQGPETALIASLESNRRYRVVAQFTRRSGFQPFRFTVNATLSLVDPSTGAVLARQLTHDFDIQRQGRSWAIWEINGATGAVTAVDSEF